MKLKINKNYKIILIIISISLISSITTGISYAYWQITKKQTNVNLAGTGCFDLSFEETGSDITLNHTLPASNQKGLSQTPYKFKIKNICDYDAEYYITLNTFGEISTLLSEDAIKYSFDVSARNTPTPKILGTASENIDTGNIDINNLIKSYSLKEGRLSTGGEKEFSLYLWLDENASMTEMNKTFHSKIYITSMATDKVPLIANLKVAKDGHPSLTKYLDGPLTKGEIEKIEFVDTNKVPIDAIGSWDVSEQRNGGIKAWYYDVDANGLYEVYIGQEEVVIANPNSSYLFKDLTKLKTIDLADLDVSKVTNMSEMFFDTGLFSYDFTLDLGEEFDTSNVTTMDYMFYRTGYNSTIFTLNLGENFDTSNVTNMRNMFYETGYKSTVLTLNLRDKFNTSSVTNMQSMFSYVGHDSPVFTLDLGNQFDTSKVTTMTVMFRSTGYMSSVFTLDLGNKFDTSNVTNMLDMFQNTGYKSTVFTLDLGDQFDTSNVTNMDSMFYATGYNSINFTLNLGDSFDTSNVTNMSDMFSYTGYNSPVFTLDFGNKFDTSNVTKMGYMFYYTGW